MVDAREPTRMTDPAELAAHIVSNAKRHKRFIVAIAGPPGAGKSTLVETLAGAIRNAGEAVAIVPMDGFHFDNAILDARGQRARKGASFTFDVEGYRATLARIRQGGQTVAVPVFDRTADLARAGAALVDADTRIVLTEGNYLLLDEMPWRELASLFDLTVGLDVHQSVLEDRLIRRWLEHGLDKDAAIARAHDNDIVNARHIRSGSRTADIVLTT